MPKNKKPKGGRPAANFDPRYASKSGGKPGSKSPKHRGYRAEPEQSGGKRRWSAQEKAGRDESRSIRDGGRGRDDRAPQRRDDRDSGYRRDDRAPYRRDDRDSGYRRDDRAPQRRDDRAPYRAPQRRDDRAPYRRDDRDSGYRRDDRASGARRDDRAPQRRHDRDSGYRRDDRAPQRRDDRAPYRRDDRDSGYRRDDRDSGYRRDDRSGDRRDSRPGSQRDNRGYDRRDGDTDRPPRDDRPRRYGDDRPRRDDRSGHDRDIRPARAAAGAAGAARAARTMRDRDSRPNRSDWNAPAASAAREQHVDVVHERLQAQAVQAEEVANASFGDLGLGQNIVKRLDELGATSPFPIQAATIPPIIEGKDVLARGRTGSGKTIAFGAPLVEAILRLQAGQKREYGRSPRALILAPTRELALQIDSTVQALARSVGLFTTQIYGGVPQARQVGALKKGVDIIIGTPGRIEDLQEQGKLDLSQVSVAVLDEADHMCELGFLEPVQRILRLTADGSQKLLFSATLDREVASLVDEFLVEPAVYEVAGEDQDSGTIDHRILVIDHRKKAEILESLVDREGKTLVFSRTRAYAEMLAEQFDEAGISAVALHGDLNQARRTRNLKRLTDGKVRVLVATDVAARGIHVDDIDLVVQADPPDEYKTYLHRSGRTGRAGREGRVVTLVTRQRRRRMTEMLDHAEIDAPFVDAQPGDEILEEIAGRITLDELTS